MNSDAFISHYRFSKDKGTKKTERSKFKSLLLSVFPFFLFPKESLAVMLAGHRQLLAAMGTAGGQHATTILCCHSGAEAVLVHTTAIVGLKCSFHCFYLIFML
jgi:hypothetical protein